MNGRNVAKWAPVRNQGRFVRCLCRSVRHGWAVIKLLSRWISSLEFFGFRQQRRFHRGRVCMSPSKKRRDFHRASAHATRQNASDRKQGRSSASRCSSRRRRALSLAWRADGHSTVPSDKVWLFYRLALAAKTGTGVLGEFLCNSLPVQPPVRTRQRDVFPLALLGGSMLKPVGMTSGRWSVLLQFINVVIGILNWLHGIKQTVPTGKHTFAQQAVLKNIVDRTVWTLTRLQHAQDGWERFVPDFVPGFTAGTTSFQDLVADRVDNLQAAGLCDPLPHLPAHVRASLATPEGILDNSDDSLRVFESFSLRARKTNMQNWLSSSCGVVS